MPQRRKELAAAVDLRRRELEHALAETDIDTPGSPRRKRIALEIKALDDELRHGWEDLTEQAAARLSQWLDTSKALVMPTDEPDHAHRGGG